MILPSDPITIFNLLANDIGYAIIAACMSGIILALFHNFNGGSE